MDEKADNRRLEIMEIAVKNSAIASQLEKEISWLNQVVDTALTLYFKNESEFDSIYAISPPEFDEDLPYAELIRHNQFGYQERIILALALLPILRPQSLDVFKIKNKNVNAEFAEFGGLMEGSKQAFIPTIETAMFILAGDSLNRRIDFIQKFTPQHKIFKGGIIEKEIDQKNWFDLPLRIHSKLLNKLLTGDEALPEFGAKFPAQEIRSKLEWEDLIVDDSVKLSLLEIEDWLKYRTLILEDWVLDGSLKKGFRALFYGPPGTGKTLAATLIGKSCNKPVFRVDLSMVVSKYIGETEKNLAGLFDMADGHDWILFFDEADALFGQRTQTKGANDRYANQEVSYLLQRIEDYNGLVILATNLKDNIDEAFSRRFQATVQFNRPGKKERELLWNNYVFSKFDLDDDIDKNQIVNDYELTGGELINILRYCSVRAAKRSEKRLNAGDILSGIKREYDKTNKTF